MLLFDPDPDHTVFHKNRIKWFFILTVQIRRNRKAVRFQKQNYSKNWCLKSQRYS